jgi:hypothetical protein
MFMLKFIVGAIAHFLYGIASGLQKITYAATAEFVDLFSPQALWFLLVCLFWFFIYTFLKEVEGWLKRREPTFELVFRDVFTWAMALIVLCLSVYMGVTTAAATLLAFPIGVTLDPTPILSDAISRGLHNGSALKPDPVFKAVTLGPAKMFTLSVTILQTLSSYLYEPDWLLTLLFPKEKVRYDLTPEPVTQIAVLDNALATTPWAISFTLFLVNIILSAVGAAFMGIKGKRSMEEALGSVEFTTILLFFIGFAMIWFLNVGLLFLVVQRQMKLNKNKIKQAARLQAEEETRSQREKYYQDLHNQEVKRQKRNILSSLGQED